MAPAQYTGRVLLKISGGNIISTYNRRRIGTDQEKAAELYLVRHGYRILERNYRCRIGEIDIIARKENYLVFIEVKYRADNRKGSPFEAVNYHKQMTISKVADYYRMCRSIPENIACRFDVVGITGDGIRIIEDAFSYISN